MTRVSRLDVSQTSRPLPKTPNEHPDSCVSDASGCSSSSTSSSSRASSCDHRSIRFGLTPSTCQFVAHRLCLPNGLRFSCVALTRTFPINARSASRSLAPQGFESKKKVHPGHVSRQALVGGRHGGASQCLWRLTKSALDMCALKLIENVLCRIVLASAAKNGRNTGTAEQQFVPQDLGASQRKSRPGLQGVQPAARPSRMATPHSTQLTRG